MLRIQPEYNQHVPLSNLSMWRKQEYILNIIIMYLYVLYVDQTLYEEYKNTAWIYSLCTFK